MKKIVLIVSLLVSCIASSQVRMTGTGISASNSSAFIDASSNTTNNGTVGNGKGLVFPRVDLSTFTFVGSTGVPNNYPSRYDGMIVYNTKTGGAANVGTTTGTLTPGFWFYENKTATTTGGTWKVLGGSASKFIDGTTAADAVFTGGNVGIGTSSPSASAALEVNSTAGGILISRMTTTQRDAIASPANALLIFNTTNNSFEVYKSTCSCWVSVNDGGNTAATSLVNTPPSASNLNISGKFMVGQTATFAYMYSDSQNDLEGFTTVEWQRASTASGGDAVTIAGANAATYTFQAGDLATFVSARVFPRAATGVLNGVVTSTGWKLVEASSVPTANNLVVTGTTAVGSALTASYTFAGGNGTENTTPKTFGGTTSGTDYYWEYSNTATGAGTSPVNLYGAFAFTPNYTPQNDLLGKFIRVAVKTKDMNGLQATNWVYSPWVGPLTATSEVAPVASNVTYSPAPAVNLTLTGAYSFSDNNYDPEGASTYKWYRADDAAGAGAVAISGATSISYTAVPADGNKFIGFGVTPKALTGTTTGTEVIYYNPTTVAPIADFTFTANPIRQLPFFHAGRLMTSVNQIQVEVNVTSAGGLSISAPLTNGYSFAGNFTLATGTQWVTLTPTGTQTSYDAMGDIVTLTGVGQTTLTKSVTVNHVQFGADKTAHFNGWVSGSNATPTAASYTVGETFANNSTCTTKLISTSACPAGNTVTGASGTVYPTVSINGQCWMQKNLKEIPSAFATVAATTFVADTDYGGWGYYNTTTPTGASGFALTEQITDAGMLYFWSAAMNGSIMERAQGACPTGWHVPSDCEVKYLEHGIGMQIANTNLQGTWSRNSANPSFKLRSQGTGFTNASGFSALLTGIRSSGSSGAFSSNSTSGTPESWFHTSTQSGSGSFYRRMITHAGLQASMDRHDWPNYQAIPVRCLKD